MDAAKAGIAPLVDEVDSLCSKLREGVNGAGSFTASRAFDGMITLAYEVSAKKISSEEETWSDLSILIFRENFKGIYNVFKPFALMLPKEIIAAVDEQYDSISDLIRTIESGNDFDTGTNIVKYSTEPVFHRKAISDQFYALGRALMNAKSTLVKKTM